MMIEVIDKMGKRFLVNISAINYIYETTKGSYVNIMMDNEVVIETGMNMDQIADRLLNGV